MYNATYLRVQKGNVGSIVSSIDSEETLVEIRIRRIVLILFILLSPAIAWSQTQVADHPRPLDYVEQTPTSRSNSASASPSDSGTIAVPDQAPASQNREDDSQGQQTKRMFWVVPNFGAVSANTHLPPMSIREKFVLAMQDSVVDYSSYTWAGILAGQAQLLNSDPELGGGIAGYGRYYWRTFTDEMSGVFFTEAIVPRSRSRTHAITPWVKAGFSAARATRYLVPSSPRQILEARPSTCPRLWAIGWKRVCPTLIIRLRNAAWVKRPRTGGRRWKPLS